MSVHQMGMFIGLDSSTQSVHQQNTTLKINHRPIGNTMGSPLDIRGSIENGFQYEPNNQHVISIEAKTFTTITTATRTA